MIPVIVALSIAIKIMFWVLEEWGDSMRAHKIERIQAELAEDYAKGGRITALLHIERLLFQGWITTPEMHKLRAYLDTLAAESETEKGVE